MNREPVAQNEISQREKQICILTHIDEIYKNGTDEPTEGRNRDADRENRLVDTAGEGEGGTN